MELCRTSQNRLKTSDKSTGELSGRHLCLGAVAELSELAEPWGERRFSKVGGRTAWQTHLVRPCFGQNLFSLCRHFLAYEQQNACGLVTWCDFDVGGLGRCLQLPAGVPLVRIQVESQADSLCCFVLRCFIAQACNRQTLLLTRSAAMKT